MNEMMLIVDDVEINREILKVLFDKKYDIMEAENGEEALMILNSCQGSIDIVLLDLMMDGLTGFDVLEKRKEMDFFQKIPVVVITSSGQQEDQVKAFDMGANEFIVKPFIPEIVISRVNNVMASNRRMLAVEVEAQKLKIKSELDEMTGLFNKATTEYAMEKSLLESNGALDVMMIIDIDNFKSVNDLSGHQVGDHVIKIVANLISSLFRKTDIVGRIGGDEFCVMMVDVPDMDIARAKVDELVQIMRYKPNLTIPEYVTLSIGIADNGRRGITYRELFKKADAALYDAKNAGKAQYREYGVEPVKLEEDERPVAVLLSNSRNVCSIVHALVPAYIKIVEVLNIDALNKISDKDRERTVLVYADVSNMEGSCESMWQELSQINWIDKESIFAICEEGNVAQYMCALQNGVIDMFTAPIDHDTFKRRTIKFLEKEGINVSK